MEVTYLWPLWLTGSYHPRQERHRNREEIAELLNRQSGAPTLCAMIVSRELSGRFIAYLTTCGVINKLETLRHAPRATRQTQIYKV
jgi:hypothetical protein